MCTDVPLKLIYLLFHSSQGGEESETEFYEHSPTPSEQDDNEDRMSVLNEVSQQREEEVRVLVGLYLATLTVLIWEGPECDVCMYGFG